MQSAEWYGIMDIMHCVENLVVGLIDMSEKKVIIINDYIDHTKMLGGK